MRKYYSVAQLFYLVFFTGLVVGCAPVTRVYTRATLEEAVKGQSSQRKNDVTIAVKPLYGEEKKRPALLVTVPEVNQQGQVVMTPALLGPPQPRMVQVNLLGDDTTAFEVKVTNHTKHVLRFGGSVIKLIDPANNLSDPITQMDIVARWMGNPTGQANVTRQIRNIHFIGPNTEVLPGYTLEGYLVFNVNPAEEHGVYKLAMHDLITASDKAGVPTNRTSYEFEYKVRIFKDIMEVDMLKGTKKLVRTEEVQ